MAPQADSLHTRILSGSAIPVSAGIPGIPQSQQPRRFVVEVMYGRDNAGTIAEVGIEDTVLDRVVADIVSGQHSHPVRVFELRDVTREIAAAVAQKLEDDGTLSECHERDLRSWLEPYGFQVPDNGRYRSRHADPDPEWEWTPDYEREPA